MLLLPLREMLPHGVQLDQIVVVVDNPRSPVESVTMRRKKRLRPRKQRSFSWGGADFQSSRWSSSMPTSETENKSRIGSTTTTTKSKLATTSLNRECVSRCNSFDTVSNKNESNSRWCSSPPKLVSEKAKVFVSQTPLSLANDKAAAAPLRRPVRQASCQDVVSPTPTKTKFDNYKSPLRIPIRQASRETIHQQPAPEKPRPSLKLPIRQLSRSLIYQASSPLNETPDLQ